MDTEADDFPEPAAGVQPAIGVDVGATLAKLALREAGGKLRLSSLPARSLDEVSARVRALGPGPIGLTGCRASGLEPHLDQTPVRLIEFEAWARGSRELLRAQQIDDSIPYLLVSVGTGTSVLRIEGDEVTRLGGTALGGGTVMGLGHALTGSASFAELCSLARQGRRGEVDLLIGDIYEDGVISLPAAATAAAFGNLARRIGSEPGGAAAAADEVSGRQDLAAAVMGLVAENVALISCGLAAGAGVRRIVYGGATLLGNDLLGGLLFGVTAALGCEAILLKHGAHAGAVGALGAVEPPSPGRVDARAGDG